MKEDGKGGIGGRRRKGGIKEEEKEAGVSFQQSEVRELVRLLQEPLAEGGSPRRRCAVVLFAKGSEAKPQAADIHHSSF